MTTVRTQQPQQHSTHWRFRRYCTERHPVADSTSSSLAAGYTYGDGMARGLDGSFFSSAATMLEDATVAMGGRGYKGYRTRLLWFGAGFLVLQSWFL
jgi:hypothetical protein